MKLGSRSLYLVRENLSRCTNPALYSIVKPFGSLFGLLSRMPDVGCVSHDKDSSYLFITIERQVNEAHPELQGHRGEHIGSMEHCK